MCRLFAELQTVEDPTPAFDDDRPAHAQPELGRFGHIELQSARSNPAGAELLHDHPNVVSARRHHNHVVVAERRAAAGRRSLDVRVETRPEEISNLAMRVDRLAQYLEFELAIATLRPQAGELARIDLHHDRRTAEAVAHGNRYRPQLHPKIGSIGRRFQRAGQLQATLQRGSPVV